MSVEQARLHYSEVTAKPETTSEEVPKVEVKKIIRRKRIPVKKDKE